MFIELFLINSLAWCVVGRLNILLIIVDDLRPTLGCYGDTNAYTPNMDHLAKESVIFTQAYAQQSLCAPSRNSFLTSRRPDTLQLYDFYSYWRDTAGNFTTLPEHLRNNGYTTMSVGKVFHPGISSNGTDDCPYSWSEKPFHPYTDRYKEAPVCRKTRKSVPARNLVCPVSVPCMPNGTLPDMETLNEARYFIHSHREDDLPFFLAVGFQKPHIPLKYPQQYLKLHPLRKFRLPEFYKWPDNVSHVAYNPWTDIRKRDDVEELLLKFPYERIPPYFAKSIIQSYYAAVTYVDDLIGLLMDQLTTSEIRDNTAVILISDHGWSLGEHAEWAKYSNYDVALRVPVMISIPDLTYATPLGKSELKAKCEKTTTEEAPVEETTKKPCENEDTDTLLQKFERMTNNIDLGCRKKIPHEPIKTMGCMEKPPGSIKNNKYKNNMHATRVKENELKSNPMGGQDAQKETMKEANFERLKSPNGSNHTETSLPDVKLPDAKNKWDNTLKRVGSSDGARHSGSNHEVILNRSEEEPPISNDNKEHNFMNKSPLGDPDAGNANRKEEIDAPNGEKNWESHNEIASEGNYDKRKLYSNTGIPFEDTDEVNETENLETLLSKIETMMRKGNEDSDENPNSELYAVRNNNWHSNKTDTINGDNAENGRNDGSPLGTENVAQKSEKWTEKIETLIKKFENMLRGIETSAGETRLPHKNAAKENAEKLGPSVDLHSDSNRENIEKAKNKITDAKDNIVFGSVNKYDIKDDTDRQETDAGKDKDRRTINKLVAVSGRAENKKSDQFFDKKKSTGNNELPNVISMGKQNLETDGEAGLGNVETFLKNFENVKKLIEDSSGKSRFQFMDETGMKSINDRRSFTGNRNGIHPESDSGGGAGQTEEGNGFDDIKNVIRKFENMVQAAVLKQSGQADSAEVSAEGKEKLRNDQSSLVTHEKWEKGSNRIVNPEQRLKNKGEDIENSRGTHSIDKIQANLAQKFPKDNSNRETSLDWDAVDKKTKGNSGKIVGAGKNDVKNTQSNLLQNTNWGLQDVENSRGKWTERIKTLRKNIESMNRAYQTSNSGITKGSTDRQEHTLIRHSDDKQHKNVVKQNDEDTAKTNSDDLQHENDTKGSSDDQQHESDTKESSYERQTPDESPEKGNPDDEKNETAMKGNSYKQEPSIETVHLLQFDKQRMHNGEKIIDITPKSGSATKKVHSTTEKWKDKMKSLLEKIESINNSDKNASDEDLCEPTDEKVIHVTFPHRSSLGTENTENTREEWVEAQRQEIEDVNKEFKDSNGEVSLETTNADESSTSDSPNESCTEGMESDDDEPPIETPPKENLDKEEPANWQKIIHVTLPGKNEWIKAMRKKVENRNKGLKTSPYEIGFQLPDSSGESPGNKEQPKERPSELSFDKQLEPPGGDKIINATVPMKSSPGMQNTVANREKWIKALRKNGETRSKGSNNEIQFDLSDKGSKDGNSNEEELPNVNKTVENTTPAANSSNTLSKDEARNQWYEKMKALQKKIEAMNKGLQNKNAEATIETPGKSITHENTDNSSQYLSVGSNSEALDVNADKIHSPTQEALGNENLNTTSSSNEEEWADRIKAQPQKAMRAMGNSSGKTNSELPNKSVTKGNFSKQETSNVNKENAERFHQSKHFCGTQNLLNAREKWIERIKSLQTTTNGDRNKEIESPVDEKNSVPPEQNSAKGNTDTKGWTFHSSGGKAIGYPADQKMTGSIEATKNTDPVKNMQDLQSTESMERWAKRVKAMQQGSMGVENSQSSKFLYGSGTKGNSDKQRPDGGDENVENNPPIESSADESNNGTGKFKKLLKKVENMFKGIVSSKSESSSTTPSTTTAGKGDSPYEERKTLHCNKTNLGDLGTDVKQSTEPAKTVVTEKGSKKTDENDDEEEADDTIFQPDKNDYDLEHVKKVCDNRTETMGNNDTTQCPQMSHKVSNDTGNEWSSVLPPAKEDKDHRLRNMENVTEKFMNPKTDETVEKSDHHEAEVKQSCDTPSEPNEDRNDPGQTQGQIQLFQIVKTSQNIENSVDKDLKKFGLNVDHGTGGPEKKIDLVEIEIPKEQLKPESSGGENSGSKETPSVTRNGKISILSISMGSLDSDEEKKPVSNSSVNESTSFQDTSEGNGNRIERSNETRLKLKRDESKIVNGSNDARGNRNAKVREGLEKVENHRHGNEMNRRIDEESLQGSEPKRRLNKVSKRWADEEDRHWVRRHKKHKRKHHHRKNNVGETKSPYRERQRNLHQIYESLQRDHEELKKNTELLMKDHDKLDQLLKNIHGNQRNGEFDEHFIPKYSPSNDARIIHFGKGSTNTRDQYMDDPDRSRDAKIGFELSYLGKATSRRHNASRGSKRSKKSRSAESQLRPTERLESKNCGSVMPERQKTAGVKYYDEGTTIAIDAKEMPQYDGRTERTKQQSAWKENYIATNSLIELVDIFPTIAEIAESPIPLCPDIDDHYVDCEKPDLPNPCSEGISLLPLIEAAMSGKPQTWKKAAFSQYPRPGVNPTLKPNSDKPRLKDITIMGYTMKTSKYRYTAWVPFAHISKKPDWRTMIAEELYDHSLEAGENLNMAYMEPFQEVKEELKTQLRRGWRTALPEQCKSEDQIMEELFKNCGKG